MRVCDPTLLLVLGLHFVLCSQLTMAEGRIFGVIDRLGALETRTEEQRCDMDQHCRLQLNTHGMVGNNERSPFVFYGAYDGFATSEYEDWEITLDERFSQCRICDRRKIKLAVSYLTSHALTWWENLCDLDKPKTWNKMKILMREKFIPYHSEDHIAFVSPMPNILQDDVQHQEVNVNDE